MGLQWGRKEKKKKNKKKRRSDDCSANRSTKGKTIRYWKKGIKRKEGGKKEGGEKSPGLRNETKREANTWPSQPAQRKEGG